MTTKQFGAGQFDERQLLIRSQVLLHGLFVVLGLLLVNAFLAAANISWANGFTQNLGILFVTSAVVASESMFRGVFFGRRNGSHWPMILVYGIWGLTLIITPGFLWSPN
ncbi:MAG: hypothetical protein FWD80_04685, partial [Propionibacteriaceae bacterium]|nr:hypothetical protein [Propionibacteriaceae bacterium]